MLFFFRTEPQVEMHPIIGQAECVGKFEVLPKFERKIGHGCNRMRIQEPVAFFGVVSMKSQSDRSPRPHADEATLGVPLEVQHKVKFFLADVLQKGPKLLWTLRTVIQQHLVEGRVGVEQRGCRWLNRPGNGGVWIPTPHARE